MFDERVSLLASQHHASQYNRSKFGLHGCPVQYLPLSVCLPEEFNQLRQRQLIYARHRSWWPSRVYSDPAPDRAHVDLHDQIMAAMSEPLCAPLLPSRDKPIKTSASHPINVSMVIPPDLIALISSHALLACSPDCPTVLEIPLVFTLDRLSGLRDSRPRCVQSYPNSSSIEFARNGFVTRSHVSNALQAAIDNGLETNPNLVCRAPNSIPDTRMSVSLAIKMSSAVSLQSPNPELSSPHFQPALLFPPRNCTPPAVDFSRPCNPPSSFMIGNLYMSSCPGKKVRLDGSVQGRSGVCRDLDIDMKRMKDLGVKCVICCLDDDELAFLGAPWPEYERSAKNIGLDVLRLPMPEGLAPLSPEFLDEHLIIIIRSYTLRAMPVLVHCRGGVGRAGVIACCWILRLGLCGQLHQSLGQPHIEMGNQNLSASEDATLRIVENVIALVRRRRSMKAVETYEQVQFLVDYVNYLRGGRRASRSSLLLGNAH